MNILELQGWVMIVLELAVVVILVAEYTYDKNLNEYTKVLKRRTKRKYEFEVLTVGEHR